MRFLRYIFMNDNPKKFVLLYTCYERIIYKYVYIWGVNLFTLRVKMINLDLAGWTVNLLALNQEETWESSTLRMVAKAARSLWRRKIFVSSAKRMIDKRLETWKRSLMYIKKVKVQELNPREPHKRPNYMKRYGHEPWRTAVCETNS